MDPTEHIDGYCIDCNKKLVNKKSNAKRCNKCLRLFRRKSSDDSKAKKREAKQIKKILNNDDLKEELAEALAEKIDVQKDEVSEFDSIFPNRLGRMMDKVTRMYPDIYKTKKKINKK